MRAVRMAVLSVTLVPVACGGKGPAAPSQVPAAPEGASVTLVSGETGQPVSGASVTSGGQTLRSDASGRVAVAVGLSLSIDAAGFLRRETLARPGDGTLTLWPVRPDAGEGFVDELVYHRMFSDAALVRPVAGVLLVLSPELDADAAARSALTRAAAALGAANGTIPFDVATGAPGSGSVFAIRVDAGDPVLRDNPNYVAFTRVETLGHRVTGGAVVFRSRGLAADASLATHEIGHAFGLGHTSQPGLMMPMLGGALDFSPGEKLAMRMMLMRSPGNRAPDNDVALGSSSSRRSLVVACEGA